MRTVHFLIANEQRHWGSSILRGEQLRDLCDRFLGGGGGLEFRVAREPETLRNAIVFVTKAYLVFAPMEDLAALKERGNFLIGDFLDARIDAARAELCDTLVASSRNQDAFLRAAFPERRVVHVTHHVDLRIPDIAARGTVFSCGYFGGPNNARMNACVARHVEIVNATDPGGRVWIDALPRFTSHYLVRQWQETDGYKPFLKGFVAAHCSAVPFVSRDDAEARHYVGDDYPFLYDADDANLSANFADFRAQFGSARWQFALERLADVKRHTAPAQISRELNELFAGV